VERIKTEELDDYQEVKRMGKKEGIQNKKIKGDCSKYSAYVIIHSGGGNYELGRACKNSIL